jgi:defect-in-organelle-trafficking protein DotD
MVESSCSDAINIMDMKRLISLCALGLFLAACSNTQTVTDVQGQAANVTLAESSSSIASSLYNVEQIQRATTPALSIKQLPCPDSYHMDQLASVDWTGPIGPIVKKIAIATDYQLRVLGYPPAIPVLIAINETNVPLGYILRDIDYQAGSKANIIVYPNRRVIELRYARS